MYEEPGATTGGGASTREALIGVKTRVLEACAIRGIQCQGVWPPTLKKLATGNGKAEKAAMQDFAFFMHPEYDAAKDAGGDIADALCLLDVARRWVAGEVSLETVKAQKRAKVKSLEDEVKRLRKGVKP